MSNNNKTLFELLRYFFLTFVIVLGFIALIASGGGGDSDGGTTDGDSTTDGDGSVVAGTPTGADLYNPKSLFIFRTNTSEVIASSSPFQLSQIAQDGENKLYQITQDDKIVEVIFFDENNSELEAITDYIKYLNAYYVYIEFNVAGINYYALINLESGIIYDLSEFFEWSSPDEDRTNILGITNNLLFIISGDHILYNIDLSTMVATPMNNPEYNPVSIYGLENNFIYYNESLNKSYVTLYVSMPPDPQSITVYCTDNSAPVETLIDDYSSYIWWVAMNYKIYSDNNVYFVNGVFFGGPPEDERDISSYVSSLMGETLDSIKIYQISIDDTKIPTVELISTYDLQSDSSCPGGILGNNDTPSYMDATAYTQIDSSTTCLFGKNGKITIVSNNGVVTAQFESIDFSEISSGIYNGDYIYYELNDSIKRASISDGTSSTILTDPNLINWYIAGDFIFYSKFITATEINTYKILRDGTGSPELVSSSDMEIIQVIELTL